jgi:TetR/AcrR family transcriptional repressor of nem operon
LGEGAARGRVTAERILDVAEDLVQRNGFNGFSYADVARELGLTTASVHYHFPGKAELGEALIARYTQRFTSELESIDGEQGAPAARLRACAALYAEVLREGRMCLCGMLAAEYDTLPGPIRGGVVRFLDDQEAWLARVLADGRREGSLSFTGSPRETARGILGGLEGAMLIARPYRDVERFRRTSSQLLSSLAGVGA